jgi:uncharacterized protein YchJ
LSSAHATLAKAEEAPVTTIMRKRRSIFFMGVAAYIHASAHQDVRCTQKHSQIDVTKSLDVM